MISISHNFLFIHCPKTAGNAIQNVLKKYSGEKIVTLAPHQDGIERFEVRSDHYSIQKHSSLADYQAQLGRAVIDPLFKFTSVRNPWERAISYYFSPHRGTVEWNRKKFIDLLCTIKPMKAYINGIDDAGERTNFESMDFFIRFENLQDDFSEACQRAGIPAAHLRQRNVSARRHYTDYYDEELIGLVGDRYGEEIRHFGYRFGI